VKASYGFFSAHALVVASHVPPAFTQSASVFAAAAPAKAGPVKASARVTAKIEIRVFMAFSPLRWHQRQVERTRYPETTFQERPMLSRVESASVAEVGDLCTVTGCRNQRSTPLMLME
jgi:hypothetical protein